MIETFVKLEDYINKCLISRLSKTCYENEYHPEYQVRNNKLELYFPKLLQLLKNIDFRQQSELASSSLYSLLILYLELKSEGPWNTECITAKNYPGKLNQLIKTKYNITFEEMLLTDGFLNAQDLFDKCIKELHQKMTLDDFKKYPGLIEVYCLLIKNVKEYKVTLNPATVLPIALLLVDDYIVCNKVKGLQCCTSIFQCLNSDSFTVGNYYEVVYRSLKNNIVEKNMEVTQTLFKCFPDFLKILPSEIRESKLDDVFSSMIDQLHTESNLYRKAECFQYATKIIEIHGIHCVKKKSFKDIICDNLNLCMNEDVYDILLHPVLKCLHMWIRYYWCIWQLHTNQKVMSALIKVLYVTKEESTIIEIQNIFLTLTQLCTKEEQKEIYANLESIPKCTNVTFLDRVNEIKRNVCT